MHAHVAEVQGLRRGHADRLCAASVLLVEMVVICSWQRAEVLASKHLLCSSHQQRCFQMS